MVDLENLQMKEVQELRIFRSSIHSLLKPDSTHYQISQLRPSHYPSRRVDQTNSPQKVSSSLNSKRRVGSGYLFSHSFHPRPLFRIVLQLPCDRSVEMYVVIIHRVESKSLSGLFRAVGDVVNGDLDVQTAHGFEVMLEALA